MNRFLVPAAVAALVAGCVRPGMFGLQPKQVVVVDSTPAEASGAPTVIVRGIYHEASVVNQNTVYVEQPAPAETVYVEQEYETYVYVSEPPPPRPRNPRWSPREQEPPAHNPRPRVPSPVKAKPLPPGGHPVPMPPPAPRASVPLPVTPSTRCLVWRMARPASSRASATPASSSQTSG